jgi:hypothetical protein
VLGNGVATTSSGSVMNAVTAEVTGLTDLMVLVPGDSWQKGSLYSSSVGLAAIPIGPAGALTIFAGTTWPSTDGAVNATQTAVVKQVRPILMNLIGILAN